MEKTAKPTGLKAIADRANVSVSLVSKVLNGRLGNSRVNPQTLANIRAAAQSLDYRKNYAAAALVAGRQNVIGGFVHNIGVASSGIAEQLVRGMAAGTARHRRRLMLRFFHTDEQFLACMPEISPSLLDGLIVAGIRHVELTQKLLDIQASGVQIITVHEEQGSPSSSLFPNIYVDQAALGEMATEHLIACGCRKIAHIQTKGSRTEGFIRALQKHSLEFDPRLIFQVNTFNYAAGLAAVEHLASTGIEFDGVVAQSDEQARAVMDAMVRSGRRIPQDLKVIGIDNSPLCEVGLTSLTSVSSEFYAQGMRAVDLLVDRIEGRQAHSVGITPVLHARASTMGDAAPAPAEATFNSKQQTHVGENHLISF